MKLIIKNILIGAVVFLSAFSISAIANEDSGRKGNVIEVRPGVVEVIDVSTTMINEIVTPFEEPKLVMPEEDKKFVSKNGGTLYVRMPERKKFVQILIQNPNNAGPSISLMLMPKNDIPGQHYMLKPLGSVSGNKVVSGEDESPYANSDYQSMMSEIMRDAVRDILSDGYNKDSEWKDGDFELGGLYATSEAQWVGANLVVERYRLVNIGSKNTTLIESNFYFKTVKAVTLHPKIVLDSGEHTQLYLIRERKEGE